MCGTDSSRPVLGGTIAILKALGEYQDLPDLSLLFHHEASTTTATIHSPTPTTSEYDESCQIVIYRDGDLRTPLTTMTSVLHSFPLYPGITQSGKGTFNLPLRLDLGVGGEGIIGRRVGLVRDMGGQGRLLRQGIIGWN